MTVALSVVVPCHNGAGRLPPTLAHIAAQRVPVGLQWDVIVVDNASTDGTGQAALAAWPADAPARLRVVLEQRLGLSHAHLPGFAEARGEIICFVEDDNWIDSDYISTAAEILSQHPEVGACGGRSDPVCEVTPPAWFDRFRHCYATGTQGEHSGDVTWGRGWLWGAGLVVRRTAWQSLVDRGFTPLLMDRQGTQLNSGGDMEICFALRLLGWKIWYDSRLRLQHFLQAHRLSWTYLCQLSRGVGAADVALDPYRFAADRDGGTLRRKVRRSWTYQVAIALLRLLDRPLNLLPTVRRRQVGEAVGIATEYKLGRLKKLLAWRARYESVIADVERRYAGMASDLPHEPPAGRG